LRAEGEAIQGDTRKAGLLRRGACHRAALRADGVTSNLPQRAFQHREGSVPGFTRRYGCKTLVWYELCDTMTDAIAREKQIKGGSRRAKLALTESRIRAGATYLMS
jgi:predicted GIY-YIG superfamily endonuclease